MIGRTWRGWVQTADAPAYVAYMQRTGVAEYAATPGNRGVYMLTRDEGDGRTEVVMVTFWESMEAVHRFAGEAPDQAVFYPEDDRFLVGRETTARHYDVPLSSGPAPPPPPPWFGG
jgi:heme-degrading monooxygenase HmoA